MKHKLKPFKIKESITFRGSKGAKAYLNELNSTDTLPISKEQEREYFIKYKEDGCLISRDKIIKANLRFVVTVSKEYQRNNVCLEPNDLITLGNMGLLIALDKFDYNSGNKFISYAVWYIRQQIIEGVKRDSNTIYIPSNARTIENKCQSIKNSFDLEYIPTDKELAKKLKCSLDMIKSINATKFCDSIDSKVSNKNDSETTIAELLESKSDLPDNFQNHSSIVFSSLLQNLNSRERIVIKRIFGICGEKAVINLDSIAKEIGLTNERVRQIKVEAIKKLKKYVKDNNLNFGAFLA